MPPSRPLAAALVAAAGAAVHKLPVADYTGLTRGTRNDAYDADTRTYWAGMQRVPSSSSQAAQVANQDDGAYL